MKSLKFRKNLADMVMNGEKNSTWRIFDDKDISLGDEFVLIVKESGEAFGEATVTKVVERPLGELTQEDKKGHEEFSSDQKMYDTYSGYYDTKVGPDTLIKIIWFELK